MNATQVRDTVIKPKVLELMGERMGNSLLFRAATAAMSGSTEGEKLENTIKVVCSDPAFADMCGAAQITKYKTEWKGKLS